MLLSPHFTTTQRSVSLDLPHTTQHTPLPAILSTGHRTQSQDLGHGLVPLPAAACAVLGLLHTVL
jgi:hypothetical protein